jgi:DNA-binding response OmpR family regulator
MEAVNRGADAYILKPFVMKNVLETIREHLKRQEETKKYSEERVAQFIETRARELEADTEAQRGSS